MELTFSTPLRGRIVMCDDLHVPDVLARYADLYKFLWARRGDLQLEVDHIRMTLREGQIMPLAPAHRIGSLQPAGAYLALLFDSNFYCLFSQAGEV